MADFATWQKQYGIRIIKSATLTDSGLSADAAGGFNTATIDTDFFAAGGIGIKTSIYGLPVTNNPNIDIGQAVINQRKAMGTSYRSTQGGMEYQQGTRVPGVTLEFDLTKNNMILLWLLFQGGVSEAAGTPFAKTYSPYTESTPDVVCSAGVLALNSMTAATSHFLGGAIARSATISGEAGGVIKCSLELIAYNAVTAFDFDAAANAIDYDSTEPLLFQNMTVTLAGNAINIDKFNFTVTNNAVPKFYDSQHVTKYVLGDFTCDGGFSLPFSDANAGGNTTINAFVAGTDQLLKLYWGSGAHTTDGDVEFNINCRYTGAPLTGDDEAMIDPTFEASYDGSNAAIAFYNCDTIDRGI